MPRAPSPSSKVEPRRSVVYVRVRKTVHEAANTAADEYGVSLSQFVDRALESYLADHFGRQPAQELTLP